jgi:hypothetical protein
MNKKQQQRREKKKEKKMAKKRKSQAQCAPGCFSVMVRCVQVSLVWEL